MDGKISGTGTNAILMIRVQREKKKKMKKKKKRAYRIFHVAEWKKNLIKDVLEQRAEGLMAGLWTSA